MVECIHLGHELGPDALHWRRGPNCVRTAAVGCPFRQGYLPLAASERTTAVAALRARADPGRPSASDRVRPVKKLKQTSTRQFEAEVNSYGLRLLHRKAPTRKRKDAALVSLGGFAAIRRNQVNLSTWRATARCTEHTAHALISLRRLHDRPSAAASRAGAVPVR